MSGPDGRRFPCRTAFQQAPPGLVFAVGPALEAIDAGADEVGDDEEGCQEHATDVAVATPDLLGQGWPRLGPRPRPPVQTAP